MNHRDHGEYEPAREALDRALALEPKSTKVLGARAALLLDLGDQTAATKDIETLRAENPTDLEGIYLQSWLFANDGEVERARVLLQETPEILREIGDDQREKLPQTELLFGISNFFSAQYEQAVENFTAFLARFPDHVGAKRYLAATYLTTGDWDKVIQTLNPAPGEGLPSDPATLSLLAEAFRSSGHSSRAIRLYERALEIVPGHQGFRLGLAKARFAAGDTAIAVAALEKLTIDAPELRDPKVQLIGMYIAAGRLQDALNSARRLAKSAPHDTAMQNLLGAVMMELGRYGDAKKSFELAEKLDPSIILARLNQARLARRMDDMPTAIGHYQYVLEKVPGSGEALLELGEALIGLSDIDQAAPLLRKLLEQEPSNVRGRVANLWVRLARGEFDELNTDIYDLTQDVPKNPGAQLGIARIYRAMGELDNARLLLRRAGENAGFNADELYEIAREQLALGDANSAHWAITKALNGNSQHLGALTYRVVILLALNRLDDAKNALTELQQIYPQRSETHFAAGELFRVAGDRDAAVTEYARAYEIAPTRASVRRLFEAQVESGDVPAALLTIRVWILLHPDDLDSRHGLAEKLISVGKYRPAQLVYEGILKRSGSDPLLLNNLAFVAQKLGDGRALEYASQAVKIAPEQPGFLDTYGWILAENGEPERGLEILRDAYTRQSTNQEIRYHIALALLRMERTDAARRELSAALDSDRAFSSKPDAQALLESLGGSVN